MGKRLKINLVILRMQLIKVYSIYRFNLDDDLYKEYDYDDNMER